MMSDEAACPCHKRSFLAHLGHEHPCLRTRTPLQDIKAIPWLSRCGSDVLRRANLFLTLRPRTDPSFGTAQPNDLTENGDCLGLCEQESFLTFFIDLTRLSTIGRKPRLPVTRVSQIGQSNDRSSSRTFRRPEGCSMWGARVPISRLCSHALASRSLASINGQLTCPTHPSGLRGRTSGRPLSRIVRS